MSTPTETTPRSTLYSRKWRAANPDKVAEYAKRDRNRIALKRIHKNRFGTAVSHVNRGIAAEVWRMFSKGRNPVDIAIMVNRPMSFVSGVIEANKLALLKNQPKTI